MTLFQSNSDFDELLYHDHASIMSSWESNASVGPFKSLFDNIVLTSHPEDVKEFELIRFNDDPLIKHLNNL